jgi:hypothetical protein
VVNRDNSMRIEIENTCTVTALHALDHFTQVLHQRKDKSSSVLNEEIIIFL